jgi:hypothetical protein
MYRVTPEDRQNSQPQVVFSVGCRIGIENLLWPGQVSTPRVRVRPLRKVSAAGFGV